MIRKIEIPPHIFWPGLVISILGMSVVANVLLLMKASSDGGAQIIDNYYEKSVDWDNARAREAAVVHLGWDIQIQVVPVEGGSEVLMMVIDDKKSPVEGLKGSIELYAPSRLAPRAKASLNERSPGTYSADINVPRSGLWDFHIQFQQNTDTYDVKRRVDVSGL